MKGAVIIFFLLLYGVAGAQTCTGGLGDPIVNISFGQGSGPGPALPAGVTNLNWVSNTCPSDGEYAITNYTSGCWSGTWLTIPHDHTDNGGGYFMLINASYQPSDFYVQTVNGLCGGTAYQFAAWIMNLGVEFQQIRPNITFRIEKTDGTVLQSYNTGDIGLTGSAQWTQYAFYFNTPSAVSSVVLRMINNAPGGAGNDLALDDITFRAAGPSIQTMVAGYSSDTIRLCQNDPRVFHFSSTVESCFAAPVYQWQVSTDSGVTWADIPGATATSYDRLASVPGYYLYRMTVAEATNAGVRSCSVASLPVLIDVVAFPSPRVTIRSGGDYVCADSPAVFFAVSADGGPAPLYQWMVNGVSVGANDTVYSTLGLASSDVVRCVMKSNAMCVVDPVAVSNPLSLPVVPVPVAEVGIVASGNPICKDSVVNFTATPLGGGAAPSFVWTLNGAVVDGVGPVYTNGVLNDGDVVNCVMKGSLRCSEPVGAGAAVRMTVYPLPTVALVPDTVIAGGSSFRFGPVISGDIGQYLWSPVVGLDDPGVARPLATPVSTSTYSLTVVTTMGCRASAAEKVEVFYDLQMPSAFTPNGDGRNDVFRVPAVLTVHIRRLAVYNRFGSLVFVSSNVGDGWDGNWNGVAQPVGSYVWVVEYDDPLTRRVERKKGAVVLVR